MGIGVTSWVTFLVAVAALVVAVRKSSHLLDRLWHLERLVAKLESEVASLRRSVESSEAASQAEHRPTFGMAPARSAPERWEKPSWPPAAAEAATAPTPAVEPTIPEAPVSEVVTAPAVITAQINETAQVEPAAPIAAAPDHLAEVDSPAEVPSEVFARTPVSPAASKARRRARSISSSAWAGGSTAGWAASRWRWPACSW